jgi:hypothetical protein
MPIKKGKRKMSKKIYSVQDVKAQAFFPPVVYRTNGEALRGFQQSCANPESNFYQFPEDFVFVLLGEFDEFSGKISPLESPQILATASDYKKED